MRKLLSSAVVLLLSTSALVAKDKIIELSALPQSAQTFITENYPKQKVAIATMDGCSFNRDYKVTLTNDVKIEFDKNGNWSDVESKVNGEVPMSIIPTKVASYVKDRFPNNKVVKVERDKKSIDVELNNDIELKFNNNGEIVEIEN